MYAGLYEYWQSVPSIFPTHTHFSYIHTHTYFIYRPQTPPSHTSYTHFIIDTHFTNKHITNTSKQKHHKHIITNTLKQAHHKHIANIHITNKHDKHIKTNTSQTHRKHSYITNKHDKHPQHKYTYTYSTLLKLCNNFENKNIKYCMQHVLNVIASGLIQDRIKILELSANHRPTPFFQGFNFKIFFQP